MSIFISIASYRDPELVRTIRSAINNAYDPESLVFSVVIQDLEKDIPDLSWVKNLHLVTMHPREARGAGYARSIAMNKYKDEEYFLQIDSHTVFEKNWDQECIKQHNLARDISRNDKIILSYFPAPFHIESNKDIIFVKNDKTKPPYPTRQEPTLNKRNEWTAKRINFVDSNMKMPEQSSTVLAGFIFSSGNLINDVPYDPEISFFGEEICFAVRAWTRGWDIYSPSKNIIYHFYNRANYSKIWKDKKLRKLSWKEIEEKSKEKQKAVLCGIEDGIFGVGNYRHLKAYEKFAGVDFKKIYGLT